LAFRRGFCDDRDYEFGLKKFKIWIAVFSGGPVAYREQFEFLSSEYGPGNTHSIEPDGNCGFSSISLALTGTQSNSNAIRRDIIEYIEDTLYRHRTLNQRQDWLCFFK
jgi:hypothetical protein